MINRIKKIKVVRKLHEQFRICSVRIAVIKYKHWFDLINHFNIDITDQYTNFKLTTNYLKLATKALHAFQLKLIHRTFFYSLLKEDQKKEFKILDFGDSSGTHCRYIKKLYPYYGIKTLSVNIDQNAINRIKENGLDAINSEIQESWMFTNYDLAMSFQVFEHLENPIKALRDIKGITNRLIITVPYIKKSGIGIQDFNNINPENTHLFLLCPNDWGKLFRYTGWKVRHEEIYYQYPRRIPLLSWLLKKYWKWIDYEGFYGVILEKEIR